MHVAIEALRNLWAVWFVGVGVCFLSQGQERDFFKQNWQSFSKGKILKIFDWASSTDVHKA